MTTRDYMDELKKRRALEFVKILTDQDGVLYKCNVVDVVLYESDLRDLERSGTVRVTRTSKVVTVSLL